MAPVILCNGGDIILQPAEVAEHALLVSLLVLSNTSPVFEAMLGPSFAEGQTVRSATNPQAVSCPDDKSAAMFLCSLLHNTSLSEWTSNDQLPDDLLDLASAADKYRCTYAIELQADSLLSHFLDRRTTAGYLMSSVATLAVAAYLLGDGDFFYIFTKRLVLDFVDPFTKLLDHQLGELMGARALLALEEQRTHARLSLTEAVWDISVFRCPVYRFKGRTSGHDFIHDIYIAMPSPIGKWPPSHATNSVRKVLDTVVTLGQPPIPMSQYPVSCAHLVVPPERTSKDFKRLADNVHERAGLCLTCAKASIWVDPQHCGKMHYRCKAGKEDGL